MKKFFILLCLLCSLLFTGCYDMEYGSMKEYYDSFDDTVYLRYYSDSDDDTTCYKATASMEKNFLNEKTQDKFSKDCLVDDKYYAYMAVCLESNKDLKIDDMCLYIRAEETTYMDIRVYIVDELPDEGRGFLAPTKDNDHNYDDDALGDPVATITSNFPAGRFTDLFVEKWTIGESKVKNITLKPDQYLLLQFYNNTGYGHDAELQSVKFTMTNFVLSKVSN